MSLTHNSEGQWYWRNWLGLMQSPYFNTQQEAKDWWEKTHSIQTQTSGEISQRS